MRPVGCGCWRGGRCGRVFVPGAGGSSSTLSSTGFDGDWDLPRSRVLSGCGVVVLGLELNGRDKADPLCQPVVRHPPPNNH